MAKAEIATMLDNLGLDAIISDPKTAKAATLAEINSGNPKRLDVVLTLQLVGNANIISMDLEFGFFFGTSQIVA
jgi:phage tail sheath gpL-like